MTKLENELLTAIRAKCLECSGGARLEAEKCRVKDCQLWSYRTVDAFNKTCGADGTDGGKKKKPTGQKKEA